ncbi:transcriptional regulator [Streptococcus pneumoniae]|uniref:transcriptional regulator n=2 Tax=Streptococcus pneumoniae TaxID=1313 RepID=UPI000B58FB15|nr:transcriptional regulator [Streptococcus pneumoniae]
MSIILAERNISWIELTRKMFAGEFHYPSELNRLYQKIRHYKMEQRMPQSPWVERIV